MRVAPVSVLPLPIPSGMIAGTELRQQAMLPVRREGPMKRVLSRVFALVLAMPVPAAQAQSKPPLKLGGILDMSGLYADITGAGSEMAAKMAVEDFGGEVLRRQIGVVT